MDHSMVHLQESIKFVLLIFCGMFLLVYSGLFDQVSVDLTYDSYSEPPWLPFLNLMPLNSLVNFAYIGLGLYWCGVTHTATEYGVLKDKDTALFYAFNMMCTLYGFVQLFRIVTQSILWSVLDQWSTLPFFSLLLVWGLYYQFGWSALRTWIIMTLSLSSYALALFFNIGFEISLGLHIISAISGALLAYTKYSAEGSLRWFFLALASCVGFVVLKLLDHRLPEICLLFRYVSGHFLSKLCDVAQIHFVNNFFFDLTLEKTANISVQKQAEFLQNYQSNGTCSNTTDDIIFEFFQELKDNKKCA